MPRRRLDAVEPPIIIIITPAASDTGSKDQQKRIFPPQFKFWSRILSHNICLEEVIEEFPEQDEAATDVVRAMNEAVKGNPRLPSSFLPMWKWKHLARTVRGTFVIAYPSVAPSLPPFTEHFDF